MPRGRRHARRTPALLLLLAAACADPVEAPDAAVDAAVDGGVGADATVREDAGEADAGSQDAEVRDAGGLDAEPRDGGEDDAGQVDDAGVEDGGVDPCTPTGRQYIMFGSAQNPQSITFGRGLANERTITLDGAYLASFDSSGCFEWLARIPATQPSFGAGNLTVDGQGRVFFPLALGGDYQFYDAADVLAHEISATAPPPAEPFTRGAAIASYDRQGNFRWVKRLGNAAAEPTGKGYSVSSLELTRGVLRVSGSVNGATNGPTADYEVVFGAGEANETRVTIGMRYQFGYIAAYDPDTGALLTDSVRIDAPVVGATNYAFRHNGRGSGQSAADGSYVQGELMVGAAGNYLLNRGQPDQSTLSVSNNFVAGFAKRDAAGAIAWHRFGGATTGGMSVFSAATLSDGSALFSGNAAEQADFQSSAGGVNLVAGAAGYLVRYDAAGAVAWLRGISGRGFGDLFVDEARNALFVFGSDTGDVTFGVGEADAVTAPLDGAYIARLDLDTGRVRWVSAVSSSTASFRDLDILGPELVASLRFDGTATFSPGAPEETAVNVGSDIWSGVARYDADTGQLLGVVELLLHRGTRLNDGLNMGGVYQP
jgi:hypothetical protein